VGDGGAGRRRPISAAAHSNTRRSSAFSRLQGSVRGGVWPGRELVARLIHRSGLRGATEAAAVSSAAEAGLRGGASPARAFRPCLCQTAGAKEKAGRCGAHLGSNRAVKACRVDGVGDERRRTGGGSGRWRRRGPRDSWIPTGSFRFVRRNKGRGQRDQKKTGGAESTGRSFSPVAGLGGNPAAARA